MVAYYRKVPLAHRNGLSGTGKNGLAVATNDVGIITLLNGRHLALAIINTHKLIPHSGE